MKCYLHPSDEWDTVTCETCDYAADCEIRKEYLRVKVKLKKALKEIRELIEYVEGLRTE